MSIIAAIFVFAYVLITLEHPLKMNKSAIALVAAGLMWTVHSLVSPLGIHAVTEQLTEKLSETAAIVFFLICAMTIVEVVDAHGGFDVVTSRIRAKRLSTLMWLVAIIAFFLSAVLDNMTTTIVMVTMLRKLLAERKHRLLFAGVVVIAANAGGAWSPMGDVTTTMLWIGGQITAVEIVKSLLIPSMVNMLVPIFLLTPFMKGKVEAPDRKESSRIAVSQFERNLAFFLGMGSLVSVPVFKSLTHLPPYMGMFLALGVIWTVGEFLHRNKTDSEKDGLSLAKALKRIDMSSVIFFIGILLSVSVLSVNGTLSGLAGWLTSHISAESVIVIVIGVISAVVDNIPIVASVMGMFPLAQHPADSFIWEFLAYCAGTGGSMLIIGSAAGVAAMGIEKIEFFWYVRRIAPLALAGYVGGAAVYMIQYAAMH